MKSPFLAGSICFVIVCVLAYFLYSVNIDARQQKELVDQRNSELLEKDRELAKVSENERSLAERNRRLTSNLEELKESIGDLVAGESELLRIVVKDAVEAAATDRGNANAERIDRLEQAISRLTVAMKTRNPQTYIPDQLVARLEDSIDSRFQELQQLNDRAAMERRLTELASENRQLASRIEALQPKTLVETSHFEDKSDVERFELARSSLNNGWRNDPVKFYVENEDGTLTEQPVPAGFENLEAGTIVVRRK